MGRSRPRGERPALRLARAWGPLMLVLTMAAPAAAGRFDDLGLAALPDPDLSAMESAVETQLREERQQLDARLDDPEISREQLAESFGRLGQLYYGYALRAPAALCYRNATLLAPAQSRWHYYLGVVHQDEGRDEEALAELTRANELEPYVPALIRLGDLELGRNRPELAGPLYARALEAHSSSAAAHYGLGRVAAAEGRFAAAVDHFERALALQPQADRLHYLLGQAHRRLGNLDRAREHLEKSGPTRIAFYDPLLVELQLLSVGASVALDRAAEARMQGLYGIALQEYRSAVAADPENAVARRSLAAVLTITGDDEGAIAEFRKALELEPDRPDALMALGHLLYRRGKPDEARPHLERAARLDPRLRPARLALGAILAAAGEWEPAEERYRELLALDAADAEARLNLGKVLMQTGRAAAGLAEFETVLASDALPEEKARAQHYLAIADLRRGAEEAGMERLRQALELDPGLAEAHMALGGLLIRRQQFDAAAAEYDRLLELDPAHASARLAQMTALVFAGRLGEARRRLEEGLEVLPESPEIRFNLARLLACAPDEQVRDGARALALAEELLAAAPTPAHAETVAMALAAAGRFGEAVALQEELHDQLRERADPALVGQLARNLERYRRGEGCRMDAPGPG